MRSQGQAPISRRSKFLALKRPGSALGQVSNPDRLDWELWPGAVAFDSDRWWWYGCVDLQNGRGRQELALCPSVSFVRKWRKKAFHTELVKTLKWDWGLLNRGSAIPRREEKRVLGQMWRSIFDRYVCLRAFHTSLLSALVMVTDITSERFWSIRPSGKSTKNWHRTLLGNER